MRIDKLLKIKNLCESRNKACALIESGAVKINGVMIKKASYDAPEDSIIEISDTKQYVSRSAKKLLTAIENFNLDFSGKIAVDLGASTGGFTQVMLEHNIKHVYALDVGSNQLHLSLRNNIKITNIENTNARYIKPDLFMDEIDVIVCDLSFISLKLVLNAVYKVLKDDGEFVCLVKPQFEAGEKNVGKNGVVKNKDTRANVVSDIVSEAIKIGFDVIDTCFSGIEGESGNREYLLYMIKRHIHSGISPQQAKAIIMEEN